jgi:hypothetical protein
MFLPTKANSKMILRTKGGLTPRNFLIPGSFQKRADLKPSHKFIDPTSKILILYLKWGQLSSWGVLSCVIFCSQYFDSALDAPSRDYSTDLVSFLPSSSTAKVELRMSLAVTAE